MGDCILHGNGGSNPLNFKVVCNPSKPENPKGNIIWVNSEGMTSYAISSTQPVGTEGVVWIPMATSSSVLFNALKKNSIMVFPVPAKQFIGGEWVDKPTECYQDGEWKVPFSELYIIKDGVPAYPIYLSTYMTQAQYATYYQLSGNNSGYHAAWFVDIDLTPFKTLTIDGTFRVADGFELCIWEKANSEPDYQDHIATTNLTATGAALDVSGLNGLYSVGITTVFTHAQKIVNLLLK